jgi:hypothetical protein
MTASSENPFGEVEAAALHGCPTEDTPVSLLKEDGKRQPNLGQPFLRSLADGLSLKTTGGHGLPAGLAPEDIFHYAYAAFHSPGYAEFLKGDFPRLPLTGNFPWRGRVRLELPHRRGGYQVCEKWLKDRKGRTLSTTISPITKRLSSRSPRPSA